ncbi:MAG: sigma-70 family RNA polymerase sigma factor [Puniceicoccales bacterium]|jgi:RNA polymerase sigma-70 factor (ECF subfamily)|nr:sigma-70 family RNA polymerase sigma factor [Puniceicoccales bacterium]
MPSLETVGDSLAQLSDADVVRRIRLGEAALFSMLVERYQQKLFRFTKRILFSEQDAEDACQNALVKTWKHLHRYDCDRSFSTWIFTIAYREACSILSRRRPAESEFPDIADTSSGADDNTSKSDEIDYVWVEAKKILKPKVFQMLWLHYGEDLPLSDVARITSRTTISVKVALFRARQLLATRLSASRLPSANSVHQLKSVAP